MDKKLFETPNLGLNIEDIDRYAKVNGLSLQNLFYVKFTRFPNCYMFSNSSRDSDFYFDTVPMLEEIYETLGKDNMKSVYYTTKDYETQEELLGFNILLEDTGLFARIERSVSESYILYTNEALDAMGKLLEIINKYYVPPQLAANQVYNVATNPNGGFCLTKRPVDEVEYFDVKTLYNDDFAAQDKKITKFLQNNKSGLVMLHGKKGTGKTTYIRHLINSTPDKRFIFIPPTMLDLFASPSFGQFLESLHDSIIILEDSETILKSRTSSGSSVSGVSLLLNLTDGIQADGLKMKFICTYNANISTIDDALLRKGRLVSKYEFSELSTDKANALLKKLYGYEEDENGELVELSNYPQTDKPMALSDIYNFEDESYEEKKKTII